MNARTPMGIECLERREVFSVSPVSFALADVSDAPTALHTLEEGQKLDGFYVDDIVIGVQSVAKTDAIRITAAAIDIAHIAWALPCTP